MFEVNVRLPKSTLGDLRSGIAANDVGASRIIKLIENMDWKHIGKLLKSLWNTESV